LSLSLRLDGNRMVLDAFPAGHCPEILEFVPSV
jgi:hypothetical protein